MLHLVATLFGGLPRTYHNCEASQAIDPFDGSASLFPVSDQMDSAWIISVYPAENYIPTRQDQHCRRCTIKQHTPNSSSFQKTTLIRQQQGIQPVEGHEAEDLVFLFAATTSMGVKRAELKTAQEAQRPDSVLTKYLNLPKAELTRRGMQVSPQGILYKVMDDEQLMMVPHELCQKILVENHDVPSTGHVGINRIVDHIKRNYWWRGIWGDVTAYVRSCPVCQRMKSDNQKKAGELQPILLPERAWQ